MVKRPLQPVANILVLGGDIVPIHKMNEPKHRDFFSFCADHFDTTYWIAGNHEYYGGDIDNYKGAFKEDVRPNVHLVNNHVAHHDGAELILSTLWSRISERKSDRIKWGLSDYRLIKNRGSLLTTDDTNDLFEENRAFIEAEAARPKVGRRIVVTHHVPTFTNYPPEYLGSDLNEAFGVELNTDIENADIDCWVFGHHHRNVPEFMIDQTRMITNQLGYVIHDEQQGFDPALAI